VKNPLFFFARLCGEDFTDPQGYEICKFENLEISLAKVIRSGGRRRIPTSKMASRTSQVKMSIRDPDRSPTVFFGDAGSPPGAPSNSKIPASLVRSGRRRRHLQDRQKDQNTILKILVYPEKHLYKYNKKPLYQ
jgi:hypothetical protein